MTFYLSVSIDAFLTSVLPPRKLVILLDLISCILRNRAINRLSCKMNVSAFMLFCRIYVYTWLFKQVNMTPYLFTSFIPSFPRKSPNRLRPKYVKDGAVSELSAGISSIFQSQTLALRLLKLTHLEDCLLLLALTFFIQ